MKRFLSMAGVSFIISAFLDLLWQTGMGKPAQWLRDGAMFAAGVACLYILFTQRKRL
ncbi:MAG: hypothetical protein HYS23_00040 [Geobacter sp.]|nr:hypothetical protein [Geobacter sp.]